MDQFNMLSCNSLNISPGIIYSIINTVNILYKCSMVISYSNYWPDLLTTPYKLSMWSFVMPVQMIGSKT